MKPTHNRLVAYAIVGLLTAATPNIWAQGQAPATAPDAPAPVAEPTPPPAPPAPDAPAAAPAAQTAPTAPAKPAATPAKKETTERIIVTGSRIRQINVETATPVQVISSEKLEKSGNNTVADFLRNGMGGNVTLTTENQTLNQSAGSSAFQGREFDESYTLVLLNGRRLPTNAIDSDFVDLNQIPMAAVERIEYLTDGASAIYGSDAIAGVLNIITKKNYNGTNASVRLGMSERGDGTEKTYQIVSGSMSEKTSVLFAAEHFERHPVMAKDRPYIKSAISPDGKEDARSPNGTPGYVIIPVDENDSSAGTIKQAWADCPADRIRRDGTNPDGTDATVCAFDVGPLYQVQPFSERESIFTSFNHKIMSGLSVFGEFRYSRAYTLTANGAAPGAVSLSKDAPSNTYGKDITLIRRYLDFGPRKTDNTNETFSQVIGLKGELGDDHEWELSASRIRLRNLQIGAGGQIYEDAASEAFNSGVLDPFVLNTFDTKEKQDARKAIEATTLREGTSELNTWALVFNGMTPLELSGGQVGYAAGVDHREETFADRSDPLTNADKILGGAGSDGAGERKNDAIFAEVSLPVFKMWEVTAATRYDDLGEKTGTAMTYKVGTTVTPTEYLKLRASYGTGFKAPDLHELYLGKSFGVNRAVDTKRCNDAKAAGADQGTIDAECAEREIQSQGGGNPDLKPEKSTAYNFGIITQLTDSLSTKLDYWSISVKDIVGQLSTQEILNNESKYPDLVTRVNGALTDDGSFVKSNFQNLNKQESNGVDLAVGYDVNTSVGKWNIDATFNKVLQAKTQTSAAQPLCDYVKLETYAPFNANFGAGWAMNAWDVGASTRYLGSYNSYSGGLADGKCEWQDPSTKYKVKATTETNAQMGYATNFGSKVSLGINNLFDQNPAVDNNESWPWYSQGVYNNVGRYYWVKMAHEF